MSLCSERDMGNISLLFPLFGLRFVSLPVLFYFSYNKDSKDKPTMVLMLVQGFSDLFQSFRNN